jgi:Right handed beta helix region
VTVTQTTISGNTGLGLSMMGGAVTVTQTTISGNTGVGISATGGAVTISQSTIASNASGGVSIMNATFDITNNFIYRNGNSDGGGDFGGVSLGVAAAESNRFEFNTVVDNHARAGGTTAGGLRCDVLGLAPANNIIARNDIARDVNAMNANTLAAGACTYPSSIREATLAAIRFVESEQAPFNYRLATGSSAIDQATTASPVVIDVDGDVRPQGAQKDIGADEYKAQ